MKRLLTTLLLLTASAFCFAQAETDVQLFNEIKQSFDNGFYPGAVTAADKLQSSYPESSFFHSALAYKGQALIYMENYDEAISSLEQALSRMHSGSPEITRCNYLLGRAFFAKKKYPAALEKFHLACSLALTNKDMEYYAPSILYSGRAFYELEKWKEAAGPFEYVTANGKLFDSADYGEAVQKLFISYNKSGNAAKTAALFKKLPEEGFEPAVYLSLCFYYGDACAALKNNDEAYKAYSRVLDSSSKNIPGINSFLLRVAVDEFNAGNYEKAETYLSKIEIEEDGGNTELKLFRNLYKAKILLEQGQVAAAEKELSGLESLAKKSETSGAADSYYSTLLQCKIQSEKWEEIPGLYGKIKNPGRSDRLAISSYYYKKSQFEKVDPISGELYASALCKQGKYKEACDEYKKLIDAQASLQAPSFDYALALFHCGRYDEALKIADAAESNQKDYLCGLCLINQKVWKSAADRFASYIRLLSGKSELNKLAYYYKGYAEYNQAQFKDSYSSFVRYCMEEGGGSQTGSSAGAGLASPYILRSYEYAVKSALQTGDFKNASVQAANLVRYSPAGQAQQKAVVLSAEIFTDYENYDAAIELLAPYTSGRDDFAAQSIFMTAKIYERQNKLERADELYRRIYEGLPRSSYAEEAMYRAGELYYTHGEYSQAFSRFNSYIYKYANGRFSDAALFYSGECALRLGENDRCVMLNKTMLQKWPQSVYAYGANKNLLEAYYKQEDYSQALSIARGMLRDFAKQAADDEIGKRARELEKIVGGVDRRVAEKESAFAAAGEAGTVEGRRVGTELVRLYAESLSTQREAFELAERLFAKQTGAGERADAAYNAEFIAEYSRKNGENKKAAQTYLKAAEYYRSVKNEGGAAAALYGAAEAFAAEGLAGDARETAALLKELYPQSIQAERVDRVTGQARN
ncbi:tetratricopeptide repeat protein [Treponema bryantii]|uniref:tetratricopeptide repeat protein n=1 Tax=Treponema bryantii TaxID=163 RepID=UPI0003B67A90|nr:tetratricopeptide repeat protein [Treponema bryantii]